METLRKWITTGAICFVLGALGWFFIVAEQETKKVLPLVETQLNAIRNDTLAAVNVQLNTTRAELSQQIVDTRLDLIKTLNAEMNATRRLAALELEKTRLTIRESVAVADTRLAAIQADANQQLTKIEEDANARLQDTNNIVADTLKPVNIVSSQIADAAPLFLDCDHNADCLFNRYVGTARGTEKTAEALGKIATDVSTLTHEITKPKPWYKVVLNYLTAGAVVVARFF